MERPPLYPLLDEIDDAVANGMPFLAVAMTVALPDICASLASADGWSTQERYKQWCSENLGGTEFGFVTPDDLYSMRCGVLHQGRFGDLKHSVARVIFSLPGTATFVNCKADDAYFYSVVDFCRNFTVAVRRWIEATKADATVQANLPRLMRYHPQGLAPYVVGMAVLA